MPVPRHMSTSAAINHSSRLKKRKPKGATRTTQAVDAARKENEARLIRRGDQRFGDIDRRANEAAGLPPQTGAPFG